MSRPISNQNLVMVIALIATVFFEAQPMFLKVTALPLALVVVCASALAWRDTRK